MEPARKRARQTQQTKKKAPQCERERESESEICARPPLDSRRFFSDTGRVNGLVRPPCNSCTCDVSITLPRPLPKRPLNTSSLANWETFYFEHAIRPHQYAKYESAFSNSRSGVCCGRACRVISIRCLGAQSNPCRRMNIQLPDCVCVSVCASLWHVESNPSSADQVRLESEFTV